MKIIHISDLHVTEGPRLSDQRHALEGIVTDALAAEPHLWLVAGDLFGRTVPHRSTPQEREVLYPQIVRMAQQAPVVVIYGNHDQHPDLESLSHLGGDWPIHVVRRSEVLHIPTAGGMAHIYTIPYPTKKWLYVGPEAPLSAPEAQATVEAMLGQLLTGWGIAIRERRATHPTDVHLFLGHVQVRGSSVSGGEVLAGQEIELTRQQLDDLPIDYGALGHLHLRQEPANRCWYPGSPWRNDFGETDPKGWHLVEVVNGPGPLSTPRTCTADDHAVYLATGGRLGCYVERRLSACREFITLDYRWAAGADVEPCWRLRPPKAQLDRVAATKAEVRMRLVVPEQWVGGCPWDVEVEMVKTLGAVRIQEEKKIEPTIRVRSPEVAAAISDADKVTAFWGTLATMPTASERESALECLEELRSCEDEAIAARTQEVTC